MKERQAFMDDVLAGLRESPKALPCKYFYDERGSELFESICETEEYYPTRTELRIMDDHAEEMARRLGPAVFLVEYGSGSSRKTRVLLDAMDEPAAYMPIDISRERLLSSAESIAKQYPDLKVIPQCADYLEPLALPEAGQQERRRVFYFPGSTIGNFVPAQAVEFLGRMARQAGSGGGLLIGVDLTKDRKTLEQAYDDQGGLTAAFNMNLLVRINGELGGDLPLENFRHEARWNEEEGRVEMHLACAASCGASLAGEEISFVRGESIHTENAYKYDLDEFRLLAKKAGFAQRDVWTDPAQRFSVQYFEVSTSLPWASGTPGAGR
ncbi:MAG: L-histidine N(alpha)-methyltransferase [Myxococcota bacterium]|nr:L-histidine N(alpha)-methyltransferase [Myxococcota bacterium]